MWLCLANPSRIYKAQQGYHHINLFQRFPQINTFNKANNRILKETSLIVLCRDSLAAVTRQRIITCNHCSQAHSLALSNQLRRSSCGASTTSGSTITHGSSSSGTAPRFPAAGASCWSSAASNSYTPGTSAIGSRILARGSLPMSRNPEVRGTRSTRSSFWDARRLRRGSRE